MHACVCVAVMWCWLFLMQSGVSDISLRDGASNVISVTGLTSPLSILIPLGPSAPTIASNGLMAAPYPRFCCASPLHEARLLYLPPLVAFCQYWLSNASRWDTAGCSLSTSSSQQGSVTCSCDHLTSFSRCVSCVSWDPSVFSQPQRDL